MSKESIVPVISGAGVALTDFLGNTYIDTAIKGIIGGMVGYAGKVILVWTIKKGSTLSNKIINKIKNKNTNNL